MNIELLEKTRDSIADRRNMFEMGDWSTCICGHAARILGVERVNSGFSGTFADRLGLRVRAKEIFSSEVADRLGLDRVRAEEIFWRTHLGREDAIRLLTELIAEARRATPAEPMPMPTPEPPPTPEPEPDDPEVEELVCI